VVSPGTSQERSVRAFRVPVAVEASLQYTAMCSLKTARNLGDYRVAMVERVLHDRVQETYFCSASHRSRRLVWTGRHRHGLAEVEKCLLGDKDRGLEADVADTVIAFGAGFRHRRSQPGEEFGPCPVAGIIRSLARHIRVVMVDEFYTSQKCAQCGGQLELTGRQGYCSGCKVAMDRDVNAARNIQAVALHRLAGQERPKALQRPSKTTATAVTAAAKEEEED